MMKILTEKNPFLRKKVAMVIKNDLAELQESIVDMTYTMINSDGIGLAATQVGVDRRIIIINTKDGAMAFINPEIIHKSEKMELAEEGCLSVPGVFGDVWRHANVTVKSLNKDGIEQAHEAEGLFARVLQHEIDHLNGILFTDHIKQTDHE